MTQTNKVSLKIASPKFRPLWTERKKYRFFVFMGGRGGAKDESIARFILDMSSKFKARTLILREHLNSIAESNHQVLSDIVRSHDLEDIFKITNTEIKCPHTGSNVIFKGCQHPESIKSIQGVDITFFNEAQQISQKTIDTVIPTVMRKKGSIVIFAINPCYETDPVYAEFIAKKRDDTLVIPVSIYDNRFAPQALLELAEMMKQDDYDKYRWIYGGECLGNEADRLFKLDLINLAFERPLLKGNSKVLSVDPARFGDDSAGFALRDGNHFIDLSEYEKTDGNQLLDLIREKHLIHGFDTCIVDVNGIGELWFDLAKSQMPQIEWVEFKGSRSPTTGFSECYNLRAESYQRMVNFIEGDGSLMNWKDDTKTRKMLVDQMLEQRRKYNRSNGKMQMESKEKMREDGIKSPNLLDACAMSLCVQDSATRRDLARLVMG